MQNKAKLSYNSFLKIRKNKQFLKTNKSHDSQSYKKTLYKMSQTNTQLKNEYPVYKNGNLFYPFSHETLHNFSKKKEENSEKKAKFKSSSSEQHPRGVVSVVKIITTNTLEEPRYKRKNKLANTKLSNNKSLVINLFHVI